MSIFLLLVYTYVQTSTIIIGQVCIGHWSNVYVMLCCVYMQTELSDVEDLEEDESESGFEDMKTDEEYEEELDPHSSKFRAQGQLMAYEEEPSFEGYLSVRVRTV